MSGAAPTQRMTADACLAWERASAGKHEFHGDGSWRYQVIEARGVVGLSGAPGIAVDAVYRGAFELSDG